MRIIAGIAKGLPLAVPRSGVRPTADRIREAIFSSLGARVIGAGVLDLFAGTGAIGLEAASRGANSVLVVEQSRTALSAIEKNVAAFSKNPGAGCAINVARGDVFAKLRQLHVADQTFALIFADPPYGDVANQLLADAHLPMVLAADGLLILESGKRDAVSVETPWRLVREAVYGDTRVSNLARD